MPFQPTTYYLMELLMWRKSGQTPALTFHLESELAGDLYIKTIDSRMSLRVVSTMHEHLDCLPSGRGPLGQWVLCTTNPLLRHCVFIAATIIRCCCCCCQKLTYLKRIIHWPQHPFLTAGEFFLKQSKFHEVENSTPRRDSYTRPLELDWCIPPQRCIIALWGWFSRHVLPTTCCLYDRPCIATVHLGNFP